MNYYSESGLEIFYGTEDSAGLDLPYYDSEVSMVIIEPGERAKLPTGIYCEIPEGNYGEIDTRSSTSKLKLIPACRTLDADYRGNIHIVLINVGKDPVVVKRGDYLAQMIVKPYTKVSPNRVSSREELSKTDRGTNGFGHTTDKRKGVDTHG
jgi:dUTP pyrophosphatase